LPRRQHTQRLSFRNVDVPFERSLADKLQTPFHRQEDGARNHEADAEMFLYADGGQQQTSQLAGASIRAYSAEILLKDLAEREGFEPSVQVLARTTV
jgi:hypothetical protein